MFLLEEATLKNTLGLRLFRALGPLHVLYRKCHNAIALPWILIGEKYSLYIICNDSNKSDCDVNYVNESILIFLSRLDDFKYYQEFSKMDWLCNISEKRTVQVIIIVAILFYVICFVLLMKLAGEFYELNLMTK